jgi:hypothetical protein
VDSVLALAVCVLATSVIVGLLHWLITRPGAARGGTAAGGSTPQGAASATSAVNSAGCVRHRWSQPRARLLLTGTGLRDAGQRIRFCLDCAAEKTDDDATRDGAARP